jgi:hypothetical protein
MFRDPAHRGEGGNACRDSALRPAFLASIQTAVPRASLLRNVVLTGCMLCDSFADRVAQGELASGHVWEDWEHVGGVMPFEVSRMHEALAWPPPPQGTAGGARNAETAPPHHFSVSALAKSAVAVPGGPH